MQLGISSTYFTPDYLDTLPRVGSERDTTFLPNGWNRVSDFIPWILERIPTDLPTAALAGALLDGDVGAAVVVSGACDAGLARRDDAALLSTLAYYRAGKLSARVALGQAVKDFEQSGRVLRGRGAGGAGAWGSWRKQEPREREERE